MKPRLCGDCFQPMPCPCDAVKYSGGKLIKSTKLIKPTPFSRFDKGAWSRKKRAEYRAAGLCRCGRKRQLGYLSCKPCRDWEEGRRVEAVAKGLCQTCRKRKTFKGRVRCTICSARSNARRREAMALYQAKVTQQVTQPVTHTVVSELLGAEAGSVDVELAVLLVAASLERLGRPDEASVLRLKAGELLMRAGLHEAEHPGPVTLGVELQRVLNPVLGVQLGVPKKEEVSDDP